MTTPISTNNTTISNDFKNMTITFSNYTHPALNLTAGDKVVQRGIGSSEDISYVFESPSEQHQAITILPHRKDGLSYTGIVTYTASQPVEVVLSHRIPIDKNTFSQIDKDRFGDLLVDQNFTLFPDLIAAPTIIVPDYGTHSPYHSASIPFTASTVAFRTLNGEPFVVVYEVAATLEKSEPIVKLQTALDIGE